MFRIFLCLLPSIDQIYSARLSEHEVFISVFDHVYMFVLRLQLLLVQSDLPQKFLKLV
jgi:hypothetical protein